MIDLTIVVPSDRLRIFQGLGKDLAAIEPPTWALYIANYLRERGWCVKVIDCDALGWTPDDLITGLEFAEPSRAYLVHVHGQQPSASTQNMVVAGEIVRALHGIEARVAISGGHPSALPQETADDLQCSVILGEGYREVERFLIDIREDRFHAIYKDTVLDPALIPIGAWDLVPMEMYRAHAWHSWTARTPLDRSGYGAIHTSFSCSFHCIFCCISAPYGGPGQGYRLLPVPRVLEEIRVLVEQYGVHNLKIIDEMFFLNRKHVREVCEGIIKNGWSINAWAYTRIDTCQDADLLAVAKQAGINWLVIGIEAADPTVRDGADKGFTNDKIYENCRKVKEAGINILGNFIVGLPGDSPETIDETYKMAMAVMPEWMNVYPAMAFPGSQLYNQAKKEGWALPDSWLGYSMHSYETFPLATEYMTNAEVLQSRDDFFQRYYSSAKYQDFIERKFGSAVRNHVEEMLTYKLKRKLLESRA